MPSKTCYVSFDADRTKSYAYHSGLLDPRPSQLVVVIVGAEKRKKLVTCVDTSPEADPKSTSTIFGLVQEQPTP